MPLTATQIRNAKQNEKATKMSEGRGLYRQINPTGSKLWRMAHRYGQKEKTLLFGNFLAVGLADARQKRDEAKVSRLLSTVSRTKSNAQKQQHALESLQ